jgi:hypothetical protein
MERWTSWNLVLVLSAFSLPQSSSPTTAKPPAQIVDQLWRMATAGNLLTKDGWQGAAGFFAKPTTSPDNSTIRVVSNNWGLDSESIKNNSALVIMGFEDEGTIDGVLHYIPPQKTDAIKTGIVYHLTLEPTHAPVFGSDGKTVIREMTGPAAWQIEESPITTWTTVNTAIRYVLEMQGKTTDLSVKKNADETLAQLLRLN